MSLRRFLIAAAPSLIIIAAATTGIAMHTYPPAPVSTCADKS